MPLFERCPLNIISTASVSAKKNFSSESYPAILSRQYVEHPEMNMARHVSRYTK